MEYLPAIFGSFMALVATILAFLVKRKFNQSDLKEKEFDEFKEKVSSIESNVEEFPHIKKFVYVELEKVNSKISSLEGDTRVQHQETIQKIHELQLSVLGSMQELTNAVAKIQGALSARREDD